MNLNNSIVLRATGCLYLQFTNIESTKMDALVIVTNGELERLIENATAPMIMKNIKTCQRELINGAKCLEPPYAEFEASDGKTERWCIGCTIAYESQKVFKLSDLIEYQMLDGIEHVMPKDYEGDEVENLLASTVVKRHYFRVA